MTRRNMTCCVCGSCAGRFHQHWNRDAGYGICAACVTWLKARGTSDAEMLDLYGKPGINYALPESQWQDRHDVSA